jgi:hypothetical protein
MRLVQDMQMIDTAAIERALAKLRSQQADRVMPLIGPLLDQWEGLPNDTKGAWREDSPAICEYLDKIDSAMEGRRP